MALPLDQVDPNWAWSPWEPSAASAWDRRAVTHLHRRAGFAANSKQIDAALLQPPQEVIRSLVAANHQVDEFEASTNALARTVLASGDTQRLASAWVYRLLHTPNQLLEKTTLFWHGHFATGADKVTDAQMMWSQNQLLRRHALERFEPLVQEIARDPAMLLYLDSATNRKSHPNENFARELMELFCLGEGQYSERDVQELARCFTGWEIKNRRFRKNRYQQDRDNKQVLGATGPFDGEDGVRIVIAHPEMPLFICRKLVHYFVCDEPQFPDRLLQPLAEQFRNEGLHLAPLIERVLSSNLFFSDYAVARKIRSPVDLMIGLMRALNGTTNTVDLAAGLRAIGQGLFYPPNVKGWAGGRAWINSSTLLGRANLIQQVLDEESTRFDGGDLEAFLETRGLVSPRDVLSTLEDLLLAVPLADSKRQRLLAELQQTSVAKEARLRHTLHLLATLPEFQLG